MGILASVSCGCELQLSQQKQEVCWGVQSTQRQGGVGISLLRTSVRFVHWEVRKRYVLHQTCHWHWDVCS